MTIDNQGNTVPYVIPGITDAATPHPNAAALTAQLIAGDAATIQPTPAADAGNLATIRAGIMAKVESFGADRAAGDTSLTRVAFLFAEAVRAKVLVEDDAKAVYETFATARAATLATSPMAATGTDALEVSKAAVSIFRTFGKAGPVAQPDLYARVLAVRQMCKPEELYGSAYNTFVRVNRKVTDLVEDKANPATPSTLVISDEQLLDWCLAKPRADKTDAQRLEAAIATIAKLVKSEKFGTGLASHHAALVEFHANFVKHGPARGLTTLISGDLQTSVETPVTLQ